MRHVAAAALMALAALAATLLLAQLLEDLRAPRPAADWPAYDEFRAGEARSGHPGR